MKLPRNDGRHFEKDLQTICSHYADRGTALIQKVEPPVRVIGWGPQRKVIFLENPFLDFTGVWTAEGGRAINFEAKSTSEPVLQCGEDKGFSKSQRDALVAWRDAGAVTFLLWEYQGSVRIFFQCMIDAGLVERRSLYWENGLVVKPGTGFVFWDFLAMAKTYIKQL
jgi:penicillin-binding protein-related factor A (putative recombinase)